jgi:hypothetical protein
LERLEMVYRETYMNYKDRIAFLDKILGMWDYVEICSRVKLEIEFCEDFRDRNSQLISLIKKREMVKASIMSTAMNYSSLGQIGKLNKELSSQYGVLRAVLSEILRITEQRSRHTKQNGLEYRGIDLASLIRVDFWELEYLKKCEGRYSRKQAYYQY